MLWFLDPKYTFNWGQRCQNIENFYFKLECITIFVAGVLGVVWRLSEVSVECVWKVSGVVWKVSGGCLEGVWGCLRDV